MFPEIVRFGPIALYSYGFMMMLAFFLGILLAAKRGKRAGIQPTVIWDLSIWILFSSLIGSRALYVLTHLNEFQGHWLDVVNPFQNAGRIGIAGMVLLGGVVTAIFVSVYFVRKRKLALWKIADIMAPSLALGIALGRIGCFANGCCYGQPTHSWLGVIFPPHSPAGYEFPNTPVLPTQLFETAWALLLCGFLLFAERWKKFDGFTFSLFLIGYAVFRIWVDTVRVYDPGEILFHLGTGRVTISQGISVGMIGFGLWLFAAQRAKGRTAVRPYRG